MDLKQFISNHVLASKDEAERVLFLAYYHMRRDGLIEFTSSDIRKWCGDAHLTNPNVSRLTKKLTAKQGFIRGNRLNSFRLHAKAIEKLKSEAPELSEKSVDVESDSSILPDSLLADKRTYIQRFGKQINASYSKNIFDGCAVLMRRMVEVCLIHTYENLDLDSVIKNGSRYKDLRDIIKDAISNSQINLTQDSKDCLDEFRELGNLSAHQLFYNCKAEEIEKVKRKFRLLVEELFNKAGRKVEK